MSLSDFDPAAVFQVRAAFRYLDRFIIVGRVDDKISTHDLFRLGVWAIDHARLAISHRDVTAAFILELVAAYEFSFGVDLTSPCDIFTDDFLHLFGGDVREIGRGFVQEHNELWHRSSLLSGPLSGSMPGL